MAGRPLFYWAMKAARGCPEVDRVYLGVDDEKVFDAVEPYWDDKVEPIQVGYMDDKCLQEAPMLELAADKPFDRIVLIQATQPLTISADITGGLRRQETECFDSIVSVCRQHRFVWSECWGLATSSTYNPQARPRRQDWCGIMIENGAFFITTRDALLKSRCRISGRIGMYEMPPITYFDIDEPEDWEIMEMLLKRRCHAE